MYRETEAFRQKKKKINLVLPRFTVHTEAVDSWQPTTLTAAPQKFCLPRELKMWICLKMPPACDRLSPRADKYNMSVWSVSPAAICYPPLTPHFLLRNRLREVVFWSQLPIKFEKNPRTGITQGGMSVMKRAVWEQSSLVSRYNTLCLPVTSFQPENTYFEVMMSSGLESTSDFFICDGSEDCCRMSTIG